MATLNNGNPRHELTVDEQRAGGQRSGEVRAAKKTVRNILADLLERDVKDAESQLQSLARVLGMEDATVKEVFTLACLLNSVKKCGLDDLDKLMNLLGESRQSERDNGILDDLTRWMNGEGKE